MKSMARQSFLVLGGSRYQLPYIEAARRLGFDAICFDMNAAPPGRQAADVFVECDTSDADRAVMLAEGFDLAGVIAPATDIAVLTKARIDEAMGLAGPSIAAARTLTDKTAFRTWRDAAAPSGPRWKRVNTYQRPDSLPLAPPVIVKPNRSSGGRGARKIGSLAEFRALWDDWDEAMRRGGALCETWIDGVELSVEGLLQNGRFWCAVVTSRRTAPDPFVATTGHDWPAGITSADQAAVLELVEHTCARFDITDGPVDADLILAEEPHLLELSPRPGGNCLSQLVGAIFDLDYPELAVKAALGRKPGGAAPRPAIDAAIVEILRSDRPATLYYDPNAAAPGAEINGIRRLEVDVAPGDRIPAFRSGRDRIGAILATATTQDAARARIRDQLTRLEWRLENGAAA